MPHPNHSDSRGGAPSERPEFDGQVVTPASGELIPIARCSDEVFAQEMLGTGFVVRPTDGTIRCPVPGAVALVFETGHAFGITAPDGHEVLIHVGIDTVELGGAPFSPQVHKGDIVRAGAPLAVADLKAIEAAGKSTEVVVVLSGVDANGFDLERTGDVIAGETVGRLAVWTK